MKFSLTLPNGTILDFDGDPDEFDRLAKVLDQPPESLRVKATSHAVATGQESETDSVVEQDDTLPPIHPRNVKARMDAVGAETEMERMALIAQLAVESGHDGADYEMVDTIYTELGLPKPPRFTKSVANAKTAGLIRTAGYGKWKPTIKGENFARGLTRD